MGTKAGHGSAAQGRVEPTIKCGKKKHPVKKTNVASWEIPEVNGGL